MRKKKFIKKTLLLLVISMIAPMFLCVEKAHAACTSIEQCPGNTNKIKCSCCKGEGIHDSYVWSSGIYKGVSYNRIRTIKSCSSCGGSGTLVVYYNNYTTVAYDDYYDGYYYGRGEVNGPHSYTGTKSSTYKNDGYWYQKCTMCNSWKKREAITYYVEYDSNGGEGSMTKSTMTYGTSSELRASSFTREGYTFNGWATSVKGDVAYYDKHTVSNLTKTHGSTVKLYAKWVSNNYSITLDPNGGTIVDTPYWSMNSGKAVKNIAYGRDYGFLPSSESQTINIVDSVSFKGGWENNTATGVVSNTTSANSLMYSTTIDLIPIKGGITLYSSEDICGIYAYDSKGNFIERVSFYTTTHKIPSNASYISIELATYLLGLEHYLSNLVIEESINGSTIEREGFTFKGWKLDDNLVKSDTKADLIANNHTLVADWERNKYNVTYHANGGKFEDGTSEMSKPTYYDYEVDLGVTPTKSGRVFLGWSESSDSNVCISDKNMPSKDLNLYAVYSLPVSDLKEALLVSWNRNNPSKVNSYKMDLASKDANGYNYSIKNVNVLNGLQYNSLSDIAIYILLYDNAGNRTDIPIKLNNVPIPDEEVPVKNKYLQTVIHYIWNIESEAWVYHTTTDELVEEGTSYNPKYLDKSDEKYPTGYEPHSIDAAYTVTDHMTTKAYYMPVAYKLYFDANGGACDTEYKTVYKDNHIGALPSAARNGYEFLGWFTQKDAGLKISENDIYTATEDTTVYARWKARTYNVTYDYATNGGDKADISSTTVAYGDKLDLSVKAYKEGWEFLGWNTNKDATTGLDELVMSDGDVILFAIYKKDLTVTLIDKTDSGIITRKEIASIYNTSESATFKIPEQNKMTDWECLGWSTSTAGNAIIEYSSLSSITITANVTLYGCYEKKVVVSFDTNGSLEEIDDITETVYYNAADEYVYPTIPVPEGPTLVEHSFVIWKDKDDKKYEPGSTIEVKEDMVLIAQWDRVPEIEAYDRYFSLATAQKGDITPEVLFQKVIATDYEDGILENGKDVTILGYQASDFTSFTDDGSVTVTYVAEDSFGNITKKTVTVYIVNTGSIEPLSHEYIRFIDLEYYIDNTGNYVLPEEGGLEGQSKWITDTAYAQTLLNVLSYKKENIETNIFDFYGKEIEVPDISSGEWPYVKSTWMLSKSKIDEVKEFVKTNGYGKFKNKNAIVEFYNKFSEYQN